VPPIRAPRPQRKSAGATKPRRRRRPGAEAPEVGRMGYDVITVGGGLGGATLAKTLAEDGYRGLVLERETEFRDRVRGEQMHPWGVAEARALGIYDALLTHCGHQTRWWRTFQETALIEDRDFVQTTPHGVGSFNCYHPAMQEVVLRL